MTAEELFAKAEAFDAIERHMAEEEEWDSQTLDHICQIVVGVHPHAFDAEVEHDALIKFAESAIQVADERMHAPDNDYTDADRQRFQHRVILANRAIDRLRSAGG